MKIRKNRKLPRAGLPGLTASPAAGPQVGTTRRSGKSRSSAGRLGSAMRDSRSTESPAAPAKKPDRTKARALTRWENEGGSTGEPATVAGSTKRSPATKPVRSAPTRQAKKMSGATDESAPPSRGAMKGPSSPVRPGQQSQKSRKAESKLKGTRIKQAGLESRLLGHVSASGKRAQARRDSKN